MATSFTTGTPVLASSSVAVTYRAPSAPLKVPITAIPQTISFIPLKVPVVTQPNSGYTS